jgi:anaerobic selenocysteine-containing dehydrogenase
MPRPPHDSRTFKTPTGRAQFTVNEVSAVRVPPGHLLLQTLRSHDQFNTTVYGLDDRYRGVHGGRRVVFVSGADLAERGLADGDIVDLVSVWSDGERRAPAFRCVEYPTPAGSAAAYFPEANVLVPLDSTAAVSNTPTSKSVIIRLERAAAPGEEPAASAAG